ncbi:histidine phosphatase family protein [Bordetella genomosp. 8]
MASLLLCAFAHADEDAWTALSRPGAVALMRHAEAPGVGDPDGFRLNDCSTQRNLNAAGREQAARAGQALKARGVGGAVYSSAWCRTMETARLLDMGPVHPLAVLNSQFRTSADSDAQTAALRRFIDTWQGPTLILVTHQVNITALTGETVAAGEIIVLRPGPGGHQMAGRLNLGNEGISMESKWQYQVRMNVTQELADAYRDGRDTPALARLRDVLGTHHATITSQYDAFAGYVKQAEKDGTQDYPLYQWTLDTIRNPEKQAKYQRVFTVYVNEEEVYGERAADAVVAELSALGTQAGIESISKLDTNPANSPQPPRDARRSDGKG